MTKRGSNDLKSRASRLAEKEGIPYTQARARLLAARDTPQPTTTLSGPEDGGDLHAFCVVRTDAPRAGERVDPYELNAGNPDLKAACTQRCGWVNPHAGPRHPGGPDRWGIEPAVTIHWRWYHILAWTRHACEAEGEPPLLADLDDLSVNDLAVHLISALRLELDHAQDDPATRAALYEAVEQGMAAERRRAIAATAHRPSGSAEPVPAEAPARFDGVPEELRAGLRLFLDRTHGRAVYQDWDRLAVEFAARDLRRLVLGVSTAGRTR
ncbi:hypothetical protein ACFV3R_10850 [Streptomyces sp. NPDC059740]|uniref:hypothetical protein n=1 Tax=Streptomyces sp. NPDC059740 TaxID=3346926 RepID=UPI00364860C6